ncbi:MAG TPA: S24 family peptidase [Usitatibacter sp.]|nr:S24 family peptidase [Usitatibacter sp.]
MSTGAPVARRVIPIAPAAGDEVDACGGAEPFALLVLGDSMAPEFDEGDVIVVEPEGLATDGAYVVAQANGEWIFRRLVRSEGGWQLHALDPRYPAVELSDLSAVRGVVIQKSRPGRRREARRYGP